MDFLADAVNQARGWMDVTLGELAFLIVGALCGAGLGAGLAWMLLHRDIDRLKNEVEGQERQLTAARTELAFYHSQAPRVHMDNTDADLCPPTDMPTHC